MPTASIVINKDVLNKTVKFGNTATDMPVGDVFLQILGAENGGALYLPDVMSVYRRNVYGSWSYRSNMHKGVKDKWAVAHLSALEKLNNFTDYKYSRFFCDKHKIILPSILHNELISQKTKNELFFKYGHEISYYEKTKWHLLFKHNITYRIIRALKDIRSYLVSQ